MTYDQDLRPRINHMRARNALETLMSLQWGHSMEKKSGHYLQCPQHGEKMTGKGIQYRMNNMLETIAHVASNQILGKHAWRNNPKTWDILKEKAVC